MGTWKIRWGPRETEILVAGIQALGYLRGCTFFPGSATRHHLPLSRGRLDMKRRRVSLSERHSSCGNLSRSRSRTSNVCANASLLRTEKGHVCEPAFLNCNKQRSQATYEETAFSSDQFEVLIHNCVAFGEVVPKKEHVVGQIVPHLRAKE